MIRVLEVIRQGEIGGGESHVIDLVTHFRREEILPTVVAMSDGPMISRLRAEGIDCVVIPSAKAFDFSITQPLIDLIHDRGIQLIHAHGSRAASNLLLVAKRTKLPLIYTVHGWSFHDGQNWLTYKLRAWSEKIICKCADRVICVSESNAQTGRDTFGLKGETVIENGVDTDRFSPDAPHNAIRHELGIDEKGIIVSFIARMTLQKAPLLYLEALKSAHEANERITGLMIGGGDMDDEVAAYIEQNEMSSFVKRRPFRTDIPNVLALTDIYCLPSKWEGLSIALLEAMSMALPVIVTPTDGTHEVIREGENGLITPFDDAQQLAENLLKLADDPDMRRKLGASARQTILQRFSAQRVSDQVVDIYRSYTS